MHEQVEYLDQLVLFFIQISEALVALSKRQLVRDAGHFADGTAGSEGAVA